MNMHSIHFPAADARAAETAARATPAHTGVVKRGRKPGRPPAIKIASSPQLNVLDVLAQAQAEAHLVAAKLSGLVKAGSGRHGDLQVTLSALRRLEPLITALIAAEETL
jgi:hypothetical protein